MLFHKKENNTTATYAVISLFAPDKVEVSGTELPKQSCSNEEEAIALLHEEGYIPIT